MTSRIPSVDVKTTPNPHLVDFILGFDDSTLPAQTRERAVSAMLDTIAVTIAGAPEDGVVALTAALSASTDPAAWRAPWSGLHYRADDAALLGGNASHALDYDDVSMTAICHPSAPVLSALLGFIGSGEGRRRVCGKALTAAFCVGTEVMIKTGQALGFRHYELGYHATATLGTLGATAALIRLAGLTPVQAGHALSIAATMSSGLRVNFGTMVKPLHVGLAAANGVRAVQMALAGVEGAMDAYQGPGLLHALSGGVVTAWPEDIVFGKPFVLQTPGFEQKRYPCCYIMHKIIEASLSLRRDHDLTLDAVVKARVGVPYGATKPLIHPSPGDGLQGKFSGPYAVVASLLDGRVNLASFLDASVQRHEVQVRLADVTLVEEGPASNNAGDIGSGPYTVDLTLRDGSVLTRTVTAAPGSPEDPITPAQLEDKWVDCLLRGLPEASEAKVRELFHTGCGLLEMFDVGEWLATLA